jgi:hypothetical protein
MHFLPFQMAARSEGTLAGGAGRRRRQALDCSMSVRRRMLWDDQGCWPTEALAHVVGEVRRLGAGAASGAAGWCLALDAFMLELDRLARRPG